MISSKRNMQSLNLTGAKVVVLAMMGGILAFTAVALAIGPYMTRQPDLARLLLPILGALAIAEVPAYIVIRQVLLSRLRRSLEADRPAGDARERVMPAFLSLVIIGAAMAEGLGLFGTVVFLISGAWAALVAPGIALIVMVLRIPTQDKLAEFVSRMSAGC